MIEFLASVYGVLVFGETLAPDGSILTPALSSSSSSNGAAKGNGSGQKQGQKAGTGFRAMSQWQGDNSKDQQSGRVTNRNGNSGSSNNSKEEKHPDAGVMLSDLPRRVSE